MTLGFILSRYVVSEKTNNYWKECINQIRIFYPTNEIIIVDDNSNYEFINNENVDLTNTKVIQSEYPQRAEMLPYYYFYKLKPFDTAVILSDSTFIRSKIVDDNIADDIRFMWSFHSYLIQDAGLEIKLMRKLNNTEKLIEIYKKESLWKGCFSVLSTIRHDFLTRLVEKYNFFVLLGHITSRLDRMCLERVFGVLCHCEDNQLVHKHPIAGEITDDHWRLGSYTYDDYIQEKQNNQLNHYTIVRVWTGR